jgi:DNA-binding NarL/FixJ family response regulator
MIALTRQEKEKLVLQLYSQGKTYRQIAEEARICPRDIKTILDKVVREAHIESIEYSVLSSDISSSLVAILNSVNSSGNKSGSIAT